jgi:hypothetical protein
MKRIQKEKDEKEKEEQENEIKRKKEKEQNKIREAWLSKILDKPTQNEPPKKILSSTTTKNKETPKKKTSSIAATLFHIISYYLSFILKYSDTPQILQYSMSIFPNICMNQIIK